MSRAVAPVLIALMLAVSAGASTGQGLYGVVTRSPTKPVCASDESCSAPAAHTKLRFLRSTTVVSTIVTDANGRYRVRLSTGVYRVRVAGVPASALGGLIAPASVRVRAVWRHQSFDIDTGIR